MFFYSQLKENIHKLIRISGSENQGAHSIYVKHLWIWTFDLWDHLQKVKKAVPHLWDIYQWVASSTKTTITVHADTKKGRFRKVFHDLCGFSYAYLGCEHLILYFPLSQRHWMMFGPYQIGNWVCAKKETFWWTPYRPETTLPPSQIPTHGTVSPTGQSGIKWEYKGEPKQLFILEIM